MSGRSQKHQILDLSSWNLMLSCFAGSETTNHQANKPVLPDDWLTLNKKLREANCQRVCWLVEKISCVKTNLNQGRPACFLACTRADLNATTHLGKNAVSIENRRRQWINNVTEVWFITLIVSQKQSSFQTRGRKEISGRFSGSEVSKL